MTTFYKDIRDLLGVEFVSTYNGAEYARLTNADFGNVVGLHAVARPARARADLEQPLDYTWQLAQGNASDPRETATRAAAGEDPRPRLVPFNWDQRHTFNLTANVSRRPEIFTASASCASASGQPYTPERRRPDSAAGWRPTPAASRPACCSTCAASSLSGWRRRPAALRPRVQRVRHAVLQRLRVRRHRAARTTRASRSADVVRSSATRRGFYAPRRIEIGVALRADEQRREPRRSRSSASSRSLGALPLRAEPCARAIPSPVVPPEQRGGIDAERAGTHDAANIRTVFSNFGMVGDFPPTPATWT